MLFYSTARHPFGMICCDMCIYLCVYCVLYVFAANIHMYTESGRKVKVDKKKKMKKKGKKKKPHGVGSPIERRQTSCQADWCAYLGRFSDAARETAQRVFAHLLIVGDSDAVQGSTCVFCQDLETVKRFRVQSPESRLQGI